MKYFFPILMAILILFGITLVATPFVAEWIFPAEKTGFHLAKEADVKEALATWFETSQDQIKQASAINAPSAQANTEWFTFAVAREPVESFIRKNRLQQQDLTPQRMQELFMAQQPPVAWWQPESLARQTCFTGDDEDRQIGLIYNAEQQRGFLIVRSKKTTHGF